MRRSAAISRELRSRNPRGTRAFGFDALSSLMGRTLRLEDELYTVIGVLPPAFDAVGTGDDLWAPRRLTTEQLTSNSGKLTLAMAIRPSSPPSAPKPYPSDKPSRRP